MGSKASETASASVVSRGSSYVSASIEELKKVQSPTRQEALRLTGVVAMIIVFISMCLFVMDLACNWLMAKLIG
jgi:preprotein translocase SecE subunit